MAAAAIEPSVQTAEPPADYELEAFKRLFPKQYFSSYFDEKLRPDGRPLGQARPISIGLGTISCTHGSALVKLGTTTVLAGVRATLGECPEGQPDAGTFKTQVDLAPFATPDVRSSQAQELLSKVAQRLSATLTALGLEKQLVVSSGKAAFHVQLDVHVLNADGALLDAVLLAAVAALHHTTLPATQQDKDGKVTLASKHGRPADGQGKLCLDRVPLAITCALAAQHVLLDPTAEEEAVAEGSVCTVVDEQGMLHGVFKSGSATASSKVFIQCFETAKLRHKQVLQLLRAHLAEHDDSDQMQE